MLPSSLCYYFVEDFSSMCMRHSGLYFSGDVFDFGIRVISRIFSYYCKWYCFPIRIPIVCFYGQFIYVSKMKKHLFLLHSRCNDSYVLICFILETLQLQLLHLSPYSSQVNLGAWYEQGFALFLLVHIQYFLKLNCFRTLVEYHSTVYMQDYFLTISLNYSFIFLPLLPQS